MKISTVEQSKFRGKLAHKKAAKNKKRYQLIHLKKMRRRQLRGHRLNFIKPLVTRKNYGEFENLNAPKNFSLVQNTEEVIDYFGKHEKLLAKGFSTNFVLSDVEILTPDAIALLIAKINDFKFTKKLPILGGEPKDESLQLIFKESGFYDHVRSGEKKVKDRNGKMLRHSSKKKVSTKISESICEDATNHTFAGKMYQHLNPVLIECMANTENHAGGESKEKYDWWLFCYKVPNCTTTQYCFVDLGVGVLESFNSLLVKFGVDFGTLSNAKRLERLLKGEIKVGSITKEKKRGKGLRLLYSFGHRSEVKNFTIITNDVYAKVGEDEKYKTLRKSFSGTLIYWELTN